MNFVTINQVVAQCNAQGMGTEEKELLQMYAEAAEAKVLDDIKRTTDEVLAMSADKQILVRQAVLMLTAHYYRNREATTTVNLKPFTLAYEANLKSLRHFNPNWRNSNS